MFHGFFGLSEFSDEKLKHLPHIYELAKIVGKEIAAQRLIAVFMNKGYS
jgi:hypothetical protein